MECIDCGKQANMLFDAGCQLQFAFCKLCIKKRFKGLKLFKNAFDIKDLREEYFK